MQERLYNLLMKEDEITWQTIIQDLIKSEEMDLWDIDITLLTKRYIQTLKELKEANFFISGKMILAAASLLKIKSNKFLTQDIPGFDDFLFRQDDVEELEDFEAPDKTAEDMFIPELTIKTPQKRRRKVSINDLLNALQKALEIDKKRTLKKLREQSFEMPTIPEKKIDITSLIKEVYDKITNLLQRKEEVTFSKLIGASERKEDKILTLIPLLHLDFQNKISLDQKEHFGEIYVNKKEHFGENYSNNDRKV